MEARSIKSYEYKQVKQWLSGYHMGYERHQVWKVQITIGNDVFVTNKTYSSEESAKKAAKRIRSKDE